MAVEIISDEDAALIWSGQTASITNTEPVKEEPVEQNSPVEIKAPETREEEIEITVKDEDLNDVFALTEDEKIEEVDDPKEESTETPKKAGRKTIDLVTVATQLIEEDILKPFDDESELKTVDDVKQLIKSNLEDRAQEAQVEWWTKKVSNYSPQIQALLHYAEQGGTDIAPLMSMISQVEETSSLSVETEQDQEYVVRQMLKLKEFDDDEINDQIATLKDIDKLKTKAEKFLPELTSYNERRIAAEIQDQEKRQAAAREASEKYIGTIVDTLNKDTVSGLKLHREDKAKIYDSLAAARHVSLNGTPTNGFVKTLEDMQFGKNADYEHFLNVVHFTVDKEGFINKLKETLKGEVVEETARKLRTSKTSNINTEEEAPSKIKPKTVQRATFRNPFGG